MSRPFENNCPIRERTADGQSVGRCWYRLSGENGMICERHGDVSKAVQTYIATGKLTDERELTK